MTGELILSDSLNMQPISPNIYQVSAMVMNATDKRENAQGVTVIWNSTTTTAVLKAALQAAFIAQNTDPNATLKASIISAICTDIPASNIQPAPLQDMIINCNSVTVNPKT